MSLVDRRGAIERDVLSREHGTGKELSRGAIHAASERSGKAFVAVTRAVSDGVLESELFGHVKGRVHRCAQRSPGCFGSRRRTCFSTRSHMPNAHSAPPACPSTGEFFRSAARGRAR